MQRYDCTQITKYVKVATIQDDIGYELGPARMIKANDGDYVRYADVESLERMVGELAEALRDIAETVANSETRTKRVSRSQLERADAALTTLDKVQKGLRNG